MKLGRPVVLGLLIGAFLTSSENSILHAKENNSVVQNPYEETLFDVLSRVDESIHHNEFQDALNSSLRPTVEAGRRYLAKKDLSAAKIMIEEALQIDPDNPLAHLIHGDWYALDGKKELAGESYALFWRTAKKEHEFLERILKPKDQEVITNHINARLFLYGINLSDRALASDLPVNLKMTFEKKTLFHRFVTYGFPILIALGIPFFIYRCLFGIDSSPALDRILISAYTVILGSYLFRLARKFLGLKPIFTHVELESLFLLAVGFSTISLFYLTSQIIERMREQKDPTTVFCGKCGKSILKLLTICPFCNQKVAQPVGRKS